MTPSQLLALTSLIHVGVWLSNKEFAQDQPVLQLLPANIDVLRVSACGTADHWPI